MNFTAVSMGKWLSHQSIGWRSGELEACRVRLQAHHKSAHFCYFPLALAPLVSTPGAVAGAKTASDLAKRRTPTVPLRLAATAALMLLQSGCGYLGAEAIKGSRTDYNHALVQTEDEQMLLNLVRLRYRDRPYFLEMTALNTQFLFQPSAEASAAVDFDGDGLYGLKGRIAFEEKPTVTYTPLQGEQFVKRMLGRVSLNTLLLLDGGGWSTERVMRVCLEGINELDNASRASGPTPGEPPVIDDFIEAINLLAGLSAAGAAHAVTRGGDENPTFAYRFREDVRDAPAYVRLAELLQLDASLGVYPITVNVRNPGANTINLQTRSYLGIMYFLSHGAEVPAGDVDAGYVTVTADAGGGVFDWLRVTDGVMHIRAATSRPRSAAIAVSHRSHWFYIDDSDLDSKSTFSLLGQLFALQAGGAEGLAPVLTLPVGG